MTHYIDKSALVAEIKRRYKLVDKYETNEFCAVASRDELVHLMNFIDTLEVKEVDLEEELEYWRHNHFYGRRDKEASGEYLERVSQLELAKHFFELGLKAQKGE